jgi:filamentous hemagglutinin
MMNIVLPETESELRHIFREDEGHVADTPENRSLILDVANDMSARLESDQYGNDWAARVLPDGRQAWVRMRAGKIINGGINTTPRKFNPKTGLNKL